MTENALGKDSFKPDAGHYPIVVVIRQEQNQHAVVLGLAADAPSVEELRCIFLDILPVRAVRHNNTNLRTFAVGNKVQIAVDEIYSNIVYYSQAKNAKITVTGSDEKLSLLFEDDGIPYDPTTAKEPDVTLSAEEREIGGLGIFMVKKMAADIHYENTDGKNRLTVVFGVK